MMAKPGRNERGEWDDDDQNIKEALRLALAAIDIALEYAIDPAADAEQRRLDALTARGLVHQAQQEMNFTNVGTKPARADFDTEQEGPDEQA